MGLESLVLPGRFIVGPYPLRTRGWCADCAKTAKKERRDSALLLRIGFVAFAGAVWDQGRLSSLGEGDFYVVEVARGDARLEYVPGLVEDRADVVAGGDVDQGEHLHVGLAGDCCGLADG